ncbi:MULTISPECIES: IclR family transcriptional regulator [Sphingobium]|uniref:IclR family transcriptional regulator n=1 Tax=Sphingobium TaxID=165695 RepID=UPI00159C30F5|nr:helix-turn-helix domain-containing protein [Sphingobium sp. 15-1]
MLEQNALVTALPESQVAGGATALSDKVVKSAGRALQVLELFDILQRQASVTEISQLLGYPQSSTSMLLRSLVEMGYLRFDSSNRKYITSSRTAILGKWASSELVGDGGLTRLMSRINQRTGQAVVLAMRNGLYSQYVHVIQATEAVRLFVVQGSLRKLVRSGTGYVLLASLSDQTIKGFVTRSNSERAEGEEPVAYSELLARIDEVRKRGYAMTNSLVTPGAGMLAMKLGNPEPLANDLPYVIGLGAAEHILLERRDEFLAIMQEELKAATHRSDLH